MRQLIVGKDVAAGATGSVDFFSRNSSGVDTLLDTAGMAALTAQDEFRIRLVGSDIKSPWMKKGDVTVSSSTPIGVAQSAQSLACTFGNGASGDMVTVKFIETSAGYEPFVRKSFEVDAGSFAVNLMAAINADKPEFIATATGTTITGTTYTGGELGLTNIQVAFDANGSAATLAVTNTAALEGKGDTYFLADVENSLLGSAVGDYDRATYLPNGTDKYVVTGGFNYGIYNLSWKNSSAGQINGVDNTREIIIAEINSTATAAAAIKAPADLTSLIVAKIDA